MQTEQLPFREKQIEGRTYRVTTKPALASFMRKRGIKPKVGGFGLGKVGKAVKGDGRRRAG